MRREIVRAGLCTLAAGIAVAAAYAGTAQAHTDGLDDVRAATAAFHSIPKAEAAGYGDPGLPCFDDPAHGKGMGFHLVNGGLLDDGGALSKTHPEALVYEMHGDGLKLVAVEYIVKKSDAAQAPRFLGKDMISNDELGLWTLHAWIWRKNPENLFATYNSNVPLCPHN